MVSFRRQGAIMVYFREQGEIIVKLWGAGSNYD